MWRISWSWLFEGEAADAIVRIAQMMPVDKYMVPPEVRGTASAL
jgi:hypothetical protein